MKLRKNQVPSLAIAISFCMSSSIFAAAINNEVLVKENDNTINASEYWTKERMQNAKPFPVPAVRNNSVQEIPTSALPTQEFGDSGNGSPPTAKLKLKSEQLFTPQSGLKDATPFDRGGLKQNFSSSRLIPQTADKAYPYSTVGKLFFTTPQGDFVCSASALRPRVILTAGHCVHSGTGGVSGFYKNWKFVPAFRDGSAPYKTWKWSYAIVTSTWATGGGGVPNAADYAMIEPQDNVIDDVARTLGSVTGWLGWQTLSLIPNHAHLLGYPCNLDSCSKMHQVTAQSARAISPNNAEYGSDMRGGSSGGPWVQNFGEYSVGQTGGTNSGLNRIVGVTSYVYDDTSLLSEGSSIPDSRFTSLLSTICAHRAGNC